MKIQSAIKFVYLGTAAWIYSIITQSPFAIFVWHMDLDQYITWCLTGFIITMIFFGALLRIYLNWCNRMYEKHIEVKL